AWKKFRSNDDLNKVRGLQALTAMHVEKIIPEIAPLLDHHNPTVKSEAQYSAVRFLGFKGLTFLESLSSPLSDWQQLRLLSALKDLAAVDSSLIEAMIHHPNISIIEFALSLVRKFRVYACYDSVIALLTHENISVRTSAVKTLQTIENEDTISLLTMSYERQEDKVKKAILLAVMKSANKESIDFLKAVLDQGTVKLQALAAEALSALKETEYLRTLLQNESLPPHLRSVVRQALSVKL